MATVDGPTEVHLVTVAQQVHEAAQAVARQLAHRVPPASPAREPSHVRRDRRPPARPRGPGRARRRWSSTATRTTTRSSASRSTSSSPRTRRARSTHRRVADSAAQWKCIAEWAWPMNSSRIAVETPPLGASEHVAVAARPSPSAGPAGRMRGVHGEGLGEQLDAHPPRPSPRRRWPHTHPVGRGCSGPRWSAGRRSRSARSTPHAPAANRRSTAASTSRPSASRSDAVTGRVTTTGQRLRTPDMERASPASASRAPSDFPTNLRQLRGLYAGPLTQVRWFSPCAGGRRGRHHPRAAVRLASRFLRRAPGSRSSSGRVAPTTASTGVKGCEMERQRYKSLPIGGRNGGSTGAVGVRVMPDLHASDSWRPVDVRNQPDGRHRPGDLLRRRGDLLRARRGRVPSRPATG